MSRKPAPTRSQIGLWLLLLPFLAGSLALVAVPVGSTIVLAFYDYDGLAPPAWRGDWNFQIIFADQAFRTALRNTAIFVALAVPLRLLAALGLALLLQARRRGTDLYRACVFLPTIVPDIAYAMVWLWIFNPLYGPLNILLGALGLPRPAWLAEPGTALIAIVIMSAFQIGEGFVMFLAALRQVPREFYDDAMLAGAGPWQLFRFLTLPLLAPWMILLAVRDITLMAQSTFVAAYLMTGGGPYYATLMLPLLIHEEGFDHLHFGDAAAMTVVMLSYVAALLVLVFVTLREWSIADRA